MTPESQVSPRWTSRPNATATPRAGRGADPTGALIERIAWNTWLVTLPDSDDVHEVTLHKRNGAFVGDCEIRATGEQCPARKYRDRDELLHRPWLVGAF